MDSQACFWEVRGWERSEAECRPHQIRKELLLHIRATLSGEERLLTRVGGRVRRGGFFVKKKAQTCLHSIFSLFYFGWCDYPSTRPMLCQMQFQ